MTVSCVNHIDTNLTPGPLESTATAEVMLLHRCILLLMLVVNSGTSSAYRPIPRPLSTTHSHRIHHQSASQLNAVVPGSSEDASLLLSLLLKASPGQSKVDFYFFFFGGSGALGIVRCYRMTYLTLIKG